MRSWARLRGVTTLTVLLLGAACGSRITGSAPTALAPTPAPAGMASGYLPADAGPTGTPDGSTSESIAPVAPPDGSAASGSPSGGPGAAAATATGGDSTGGGATPKATAATPGPGRAVGPTGGAGPAASGGASASPASGAGGAAPAPAGSPAAGQPQVFSQGVLPDQIKIGVLAPISGAAGFLGEAEVASLRAYFEMVNAEGGVGGRPYRMVVLDTQFEPSVEATATKRLVDQDKVFALYSVLGDAAAPYVASKGIPNFVIGATPVSFSSKYPTTYPVLNTIGNTIEMGYQLTQVLKKPIKSAAILYDTQNINIGPWAKYMQKAWEAFGVQVKSMDAFNLSDADCTQLVVKMQRLGIDYWQAGQSLGWPICEQAMARQRYRPPLGRGGTYTPDAYFISQAGPSGDGIVAQNFGVQVARNTGQPWPYDPSGKAPEVDRFIASMKRFSPGNADVRSLESAWTQLFWSEAKLLDQAVRASQAGGINWAGVNKWIQSQTAWNSGLIAPVNFTPKCKSASPLFMFDWRFVNGQYAQSDWQPWGGRVNMPVDFKNKIIPGAGDCYLTAMADAEL